MMYRYINDDCWYITKLPQCFPVSSQCAMYLIIRNAVPLIKQKLQYKITWGTILTNGKIILQVRQRKT